MDVLKELSDTQPTEQLDNINETAPSSEPQLEQPAAAPSEPKWDGTQWSFDWSGKKVVPDSPDKLKRWASQGYDYAQRLDDFRKQQTEFQTQSKQHEEKYGKYRQIDEYAAKDPQWWEHVDKEYKNRLASEDPVVQRVKGMLEEQLTPFKQLLAEKEQKETEAKLQAEDNALSTNIKSVREKYSNLDFDTPGADGKSLEYKVLEHGATHRFPTFKAAFLDFYHEQLEKMWESRGREALQKGSLANAKAGIIAKGSSPQQGKPTKSFDIKGKSWAEVQNAARQMTS